MKHEVELPDVGEGVADGEILEWYIEVGDDVDRRQPLVEVETDKAVVEIPCPAAGKVLELHGDVGDVIRVGTVIAILDVEGDPGAAAEQGSTTASNGASLANGASGGDVGSSGKGSAALDDGDSQQQSGIADYAVSDTGGGGDSLAASASASGPSSPGVDGGGPGGNVAATQTQREADGDVLAVPAARGVAWENDVDLSAVPPTAERDGQPVITVEAVQQYVSSGGAASQITGRFDGEQEKPVEVVPYRGVRRTIGENMKQSRFSAPHYTGGWMVEVEELVEAREELNAVAKERGFRLTYVPFFVKAVTAGLIEVPYMNASIDEEAGEIYLKGYYNIGVPVATENGVLVPVIKDADQKGLFDIAKELDDYIERANEGKLTQEDMADSTFTITSGGGQGGNDFGTAIINPGEAAILGFGHIKKRPRVNGDDVVARQTVPLFLSSDHRIVDGMTGVQFYQIIKEYLQDPYLLLAD